MKEALHAWGKYTSGEPLIFRAKETWGSILTPPLVGSDKSLNLQELPRKMGVNNSCLAVFMQLLAQIDPYCLPF